MDPLYSVSVERLVCTVEPGAAERRCLLTVRLSNARSRELRPCPHPHIYRTGETLSFAHPSFLPTAHL